MNVSSLMTRYDAAIAAIDAANAQDPNRILQPDGREQAAEAVYSAHMSAMLAQLYPEASEPLRLAVRAQHIRRWEVPRSDYAMDRAGYHRWRNDLKRRHAGWTASILRTCGYSDADIERTCMLIRKENLRLDPETQALEDTACLVFLAHYAEAFAAKHDEAKLLGILSKTWAKMSAYGQSQALELNLPPAIRVLVTRAVSETK